MQQWRTRLGDVWAGIPLAVLAVAGYSTFRPEVLPAPLAGWFPVPFGVIGVGAVVALARALDIRAARWRRRMGAAAVLALLPLGAWSVFYSDLGILVWSHRFWVRHAAEAADDDAARRALELVLQATQYGPTVTVQDFEEYPGATQVRLLRLAAEVTPRAGLRERLLERAGSLGAES